MPSGVEVKTLLATVEMLSRRVDLLERSVEAGRALKYRTLGRTGLRVSAVSMGAAGLGNVYGTLPSGEAKSIVDTCLDRGINTFDTSPYCKSAPAAICFTARGRVERPLPTLIFVVSAPSFSPPLLLSNHTVSTSPPSRRWHRQRARAWRMPPRRAPRQVCPHDKGRQVRQQRRRPFEERLL